MNRIRIAIVDDHEVVRLGLRTLIESDAAMDVVSEAGTAKEALDYGMVDEVLSQNPKKKQIKE